MQIISGIDEWKAWRKGVSKGETIGFVPTMGCLHAGHAALLSKARAENDAVVLSIYVNPTQFNEASDLENYPQTLDSDLALAEELGVDAVFLPSDAQMYASLDPAHKARGVGGKEARGVGGKEARGAGGKSAVPMSRAVPTSRGLSAGSSQKAFTINSQHAWTTVGEGAARPGHFSGVLTIVMKLLILVKATRVYLGEKDYQQYRLVEAMVDSFLLSVKVVPVETVREKSGLAMSSRNTLLSAEERELADRFAVEFLKPNRSLEALREALLLLPFELEYLIEEGGRWLVAVRIGSVRLIDNREGD